jgi:FkbH-like protein
MECLLFPGNDGAAFLDLINILRDRFGKEDVSLEDSLRVNSLRNQPRPEMVSIGDSDNFLESLQGRIRIVINQPDKRTLELINKTNQFNLNGHRIDHSSWQNRLKKPGNFVWSIYYQDKFGPLGQICAVSGTLLPDCGLLVDVWIISCRAFSRRIEHHIMGKLLESSPDGVVRFKYQPTERNKVLKDFLLSISGKKDDDGDILDSIEKSVFWAHCPPLCHEVIVQ